MVLLQCLDVVGIVPEIGHRTRKEMVLLFFSIEQAHHEYVFDERIILLTS